MAHLYEIPYRADDGQRWPVRIDGSVARYFPSRFEALREALNLAVAEKDSPSIRIEGADGVWRPFDSDAKRPMPQRSPGNAPNLSVVR